MLSIKNNTFLDPVQFVLSIAKLVAHTFVVCLVFTRIARNNLAHVRDNVDRMLPRSATQSRKDQLINANAQMAIDHLAALVFWGGRVDGRKALQKRSSFQTRQRTKTQCRQSILWKNDYIHSLYEVNKSRSAIYFYIETLGHML